MGFEIKIAKRRRERARLDRTIAKEMKPNDIDLAKAIAKSLEPLFKEIARMPAPPQVVANLKRHFRYRVCQSCGEEFEVKYNEHTCFECVQCCDAPDTYTVSTRGDDEFTLTTKHCRNCGKQWDIES